MSNLPILFNGLGAAGIALSVNRFALGCFFSISGYHKLFNRERHSTIQQTMVENHIPYPIQMSWIVPIFEFSCGLSLVAGLLSPLASVALIIIMCVAVCTDGRRRLHTYQPIDRADLLDDFLYLPEVLYLLGLLVVGLAGPGTVSIDYYIAGVL